MARREKRLDDFTRAYIEAALWSSTGDDGEPLDRDYDLEDFAPETIKTIVKDTKAFQQENEDDLDTAAEYQGRSEWSSDQQHGHDFWLTRNRHGAGFWDRGYPDALGDRLSKASQDYGEIDLYVGDDGLLYL